VGESGIALFIDKDRDCVAVARIVPIAQLLEERMLLGGCPFQRRRVQSHHGLCTSRERLAEQADRIALVRVV